MADTNITDQNSSTFFDRLKKLFSSTIIIKQPGEDKLKFFDMNKFQTMAHIKHNRLVPTVSTSGLTQSGVMTSRYGFQLNKNELYFDYEMMDMHPILSSAIDIYADESCLRNNDGNVLRIKSQYDDVQKSLENLFYDILDVNYNLWWWIRNTCKYGNHYMKLDLAEGIGVLDVVPLSPYAMTRIENYVDKSVEYAYDDTGGMQMYVAGRKKNFEDYEIVHFRLMADSNFLPYGKSILEPARRIWKQVTLMEDSMLINRIMRAPQKRVFYIDVGNLAPDAIDTYMQEISDSMKKVPHVDPETGEYNLKYNIQNLLEDFFIPVRGDKGASRIETLEGMEYTGMDDIKYLQNQMFAALKVPRAFLGYEESINAKATLSGEDVRFARTIERVQRMIEADLTKIAFVHLYIQGYNPEALADFEISLTPSSAVAEMEKLEILEKKISISRDIQDLKLFSGNYIYDTLFHMSEDEMNDEITKLVDTTKIKWRLTQIEETGIDPISEEKTEETKEDVEGPEFEEDHIADNEEASGAPSEEAPDETPGGASEEKPAGTIEQPAAEEKPAGGGLAKQARTQRTTPKEKPGLESMTLA